MDILNKKYDDNDDIVDEYNDTKQRVTAIPIVNTYFNDNFISYGLYEIDLKSTINPDVYVELEGASWRGDHRLSSQYDRFDCGCETINVPERKLPMVGLEITHPEILKNREKRFEKYKGLKIHFGRFNKNYDQFILIPHEVLIDPNKRIIKYNQTTKKSKVLENFACYPIEHCLVFNLQPDGKWELNGKYWGPTQEEINEQYRIKQEELEKIRIPRVREVMKNKNRYYGKSVY